MNASDLLTGDQQIQPKHPVFARAKKGPFLCATCEHFVEGDACDSRKLIADKACGTEGTSDLTLTRRKGRRVLVTIMHGDCCDYHEKGRPRP